MKPYALHHTVMSPVSHLFLSPSFSFSFSFSLSFPLLILFFLSSCTKDDYKATDTRDLLAGEYHCTYKKWGWYIDGILTDTPKTKAIPIIDTTCTVSVTKGYDSKNNPGIFLNNIFYPSSSNTDSFGQILYSPGLAGTSYQYKVIFLNGTLIDTFKYESLSAATQVYTVRIGKKK